MRKSALLIVFVLLSAMTKAQKPVLFKFQYLPAHTYGIITKAGMNAKIAMKDLSAKAGKKTDTTTMIMAVDTEWGTTVKTDAIAAGSFPVTVLGNQFSMKTTLNGTEAPVAPEVNLLQGLTVKGKMDAAGKMVLDTATADSKIKLVVGTLIGGMPERLKFPDKPMKVGDAFNHEVTLSAMNLPDFGIDTDYPTTVTYKLTAMKGNVAYFDTTSEFKMNINKEAEGKTVKIDGKGTGTGKMEFFTDKGYPKLIVNNINCVFKMAVTSSEVTVEVNLITDAKYDVNSN